MKNDGYIHEMIQLSAECPKPSGTREISVMNEDLGYKSEDQLHYLTRWLDISQNSERNKTRIHQFGKKLLRWIVLVMLYSRDENLGRRYFNWWGWRNGKFGVIEIHFRRLSAKRVLITQRDEEFVFLAADGSAKLSGRSYEFQEPTLRREKTVRERISLENRMAMEKCFNLKKQQMTKESKKIFGLTQKLGKTYRHHIEPRSSIARAEKRIISYSTEYFWFHQVNLCGSGDCTKKRIYDYWDVDENRNLSDSWTSFTRFALLNKTPMKRYNQPGRKLTRIQTTSRPDHIWPDALTRIGKADLRRNKNDWIEKLLFHAEDRVPEHAYGKPMFQNNQSPSVWSKIHVCWYCRWKNEIWEVFQLGTPIGSMKRSDHLISHFSGENKRILCESRVYAQMVWVYTQTKYGYWETESYEWFRQFWISVSQRRTHWETEKDESKTL